MPDTKKPEAKRIPEAIRKMGSGTKKNPSPQNADARKSPVTTTIL
jgi:hypothetical protein